MKNIILLAPPAAGKGTQSTFLKERYGFDHISTGELLREVVNSGSELGKKIDELMNNGILVDDELMLEMIKNKIDSLGDIKGIIFDGFPRNVKQAKMLDELMSSLNQSVDHVIYLQIDKDRAMKRTLGRLTCSKCGYIFNKYIDQFEVEGICNKCHAELDKRSDDNEESFIKRFNTYLDNIKSLLDYYEAKGILSTVSCAEEREETFERIEEIINKGWYYDYY